MNDQFDELVKGMAQSVTRRGALRKFGFGLLGAALAALGLPQKAYAGKCVDHTCLNACKKSCDLVGKRNSDPWNQCMIFCSSSCIRNCGV